MKIVRLRDACAVDEPSKTPNLVRGPHYLHRRRIGRVDCHRPCRVHYEATNREMARQRCGMHSIETDDKVDQMVGGIKPTSEKIKDAVRK